MLMKPKKIFYSQDSINNIFDRRSSHCDKYIGSTLDDLVEGRCDVTDIPQMSVCYKYGKWFTCDNRRLWVFKQLEALGKIRKIDVYPYGYLTFRKFTTKNGGVSVRVRGDPGGRWHSEEEDDDSSDSEYDDYDYPSASTDDDQSASDDDDDGSSDSEYDDDDYPSASTDDDQSASDRDDDDSSVSDEDDEYDDDPSASDDDDDNRSASDDDYQSDTDDRYYYYRSKSYGDNDQSDSDSDNDDYWYCR